MIIKVEGRRIHAVTRGEGPDLVLIHGTSGSKRGIFFGLVGRLTGRVLVTAFDRPELSFSDTAPCHDRPFDR